MTNPIADPGHGHSPAAWTGVVIMLIALSIGTIAVYFWSIPVLIASAVLLVLGPIIGWLVSKAGYGVHGPKFQPKVH